MSSHSWTLRKRYSVGMGVRVALMAVGLAASCCAQQPDPAQLLQRIREKVADSISRIPRYLCTETVERQKTELPAGAKRKSCADVLPAFEKNSRHLQIASADRLRLDVAVVDKQEIYSWVGEDRFGNQSLSQLVRAGLTANGSFGSFLTAIFTTRQADFSYKGEAQINGRRALQYQYRVPLANSTYGIGNNKVNHIVPYSGTFLADAETLDLLKLEIQVEEIPADLNFCRVASEMDYNKLRVDNVDFLLPSEASSLIIHSNGSESRNRTVFSGCHQFLGESKLVFDDAPAPTPGTLAKEKLPAIPAGLTFLIKLNQKIDPTTAAAGDLVKGSLSKAVQIPGANVTFPAGTLVEGRLCLLLAEYSQDVALQFGLRWDKLNFGSNTQALRLSLQEPVRATAKTWEVYVKQSLAGIGDGYDDTIGYMVFPYVKKNYQIPAGFEARWVSLGDLSTENGKRR